MSAGGYSSSSQLLAKQKELKEAQVQYERIKGAYAPVTNYTTDLARATSTTIDNNINAISNVNPPPGVGPGDDFGEYWKSVNDPTLEADKNSGTCWNAASADSRLFKKVVYTGTSNTSDTKWDKLCYGLIHYAPDDASYTTPATGYNTMITTAAGALPNTPGGFTKLGINGPADIEHINDASKLYDLEQRIKTLVSEIGTIAQQSINSEITQLSASSSESQTVTDKLNIYMNDSARDISNNYDTIAKKQNLINIYDEINNQVRLKTKKYRFALYFIIGLALVIGYLSYVSTLTLSEQFERIIQFISFGWWKNWGIITAVFVLLLLSSFGWDMRGNITTVFRFLTDARFWTGELWWIGVTFLLLLVIYFYSSFKKFFNEFLPNIEKI
jgi:hypothetical protein